MVSLLASFLFAPSHFLSSQHSGFFSVGFCSRLSFSLSIAVCILACSLVRTNQNFNPQYISIHMDKNHLFVEEEEMSDSPALDQYQDTLDHALPVDEDPIILSIPILHGGLPNRTSQSIHVLQYAGRPKSRPFSADQLRVSVKPKSKVVELKVPMDTLKFYDDGRADLLGTRVDALSLQGVFTDTDGGLYVGKVVENDGQPNIVLIPLDSTGQLRPLFKYIDDLDAARLAQFRQETATQDTKASAVHVLQTTLKASQLNSEGHAASSIGSCLRHVKNFNEEEWESLSWRNGDDTATVRLKEGLSCPSGEPVATTTVFDEFA